MCLDSLIGLPLWSVSSRAISSARSISRSPSFRTSRPRSRADICPQGPFSAARAASTAAFRSAVSADPTEAQTSSVAGLITSIVLPDAAGRHWLLMKSCLCSDNWLFSSERRFPFFQVRRDAFLRVVTLEQQLLQLALYREPLEKPRLGAGLHRALHAADRAARLVRRRELPRVGKDGVAEAPARQIRIAPHLGDDPERLRLVHRHQPAGR